MFRRSLVVISLLVAIPICAACFPQLESTVPPADQGNSPLASVIKATFTRPLDFSTFDERTFVVEKLDNGSPVQGALSSEDSERTVRFSPQDPYPLEEYTEYRVTIKAGVQDLAGNILLQDLSWSFTTGGKTRGVSITLDDPVALIITTEALRPSYEKFAILHSLTGIHVGVETIENICGAFCDDADPANDTAKHIKEYLVNMPSLSYLIIGGDVEDVPTRWVFDEYYWDLTYPFFGQEIFVTSEDCYEYFATDYYYADFAEWDSNGDGFYLTSEDDPSDLRPEIAVSRIPFSSEEKIAGYYRKVVDYMTAYERDHIEKILLEAGIYDTFCFFGECSDLTNAWYYHSPERTIDIVKENTAFRITKQYETVKYTPDPNALPYTADSHLALIEEGQNFVLHSGHGSEFVLRDGLTCSKIQTMNNSTYPILISSACHGANFAWNDSVGECVIGEPDKGAIAYVGNSGYGIGLNGGMEFVDEVLRYSLSAYRPILGDALFAAYTQMPMQDDFLFPFSVLRWFLRNIYRPVVTEDTYQFQQKTAATLGDCLIPIWNRPVDVVPEVIISKESVDGPNIMITIAPTEQLDEVPVIYSDSGYYSFYGVGGLYEVVMPASETIYIGVPASDKHQCFLAEILE